MIRFVLASILAVLGGCAQAPAITGLADLMCFSGGRVVVVGEYTVQGTTEGGVLVRDADGRLAFFRADCLVIGPKS